MEFTEQEKEALESISGWSEELSRLAESLTSLPKMSNLYQIANKYVNAEDEFVGVLHEAESRNLFEWG